MAVVRARRRSLWPSLAGALAALLAGARLDRPARAEAPTEYQVKAAYLFNFAKYVEWPRGTFKTEDAPIVIGVVGEDPFGEALDDALEGKVVEGRKLVAKRFASAEDARGAQIVFIAASEEPRLRQDLATLSGRSVLTVGDVDRFAERGGIAGFYTEGSKVRFRINVAAAARADLKISSQLLKLARIVSEEPGK